MSETNITDKVHRINVENQTEWFRFSSLRARRASSDFCQALPALQTKYVAINPDDYAFFTVILFLDVDLVLKLSANYVRQEQIDEATPSYAFEFIEMKNRDINATSKYLTKKQLEQIKQEKKLNLYK